jgi:hypothetical protein
VTADRVFGRIRRRTVAVMAVVAVVAVMMLVTARAWGRMFHGTGM